jgi:hypothetical protein
MATAKVIYDERVEVLKGVFEARIVAYEVSKNKKYPDGIKLRCVLLDIQENAPRLLLDNHEPFGYHLHTKLPHDKEHRVPVEVSGYEDAIMLFLREVQKVVANEV